MNYEEKSKIFKDIKDDFETLKIQGSILVNKGELTPQEYYGKIREKGLEYGIIQEDQYPGALPGVLEDAFRVTGNIIGGVYSRNNPVAVGAGGAIGQSIFDGLNTFYTNKVRPGVQTKPMEQIGEDMAKVFVVDTALTKGFNMAVTGVGKTSTLIKNKFGKLSDEQLQKVGDKLKLKDKMKGGGKVIKDQLKQQEEAIELAAKELEAEGVSPTRYFAFNASGFGEVLRGIAESTGVLPIIGAPAKEAFKNSIKQIFLSSTEGVEQSLKNSIQARGGFFNKGAFELNVKGEITRNDNFSQQFLDEIPFDILREVQRQAGRRIKEVQNLYKGYDTSLRELSKKGLGNKANFSIYDDVNITNSTGNTFGTSLSKLAMEVNEKLKIATGKTNLKFAPDLPVAIKSLIPTTTQSFKLQGLNAGIVETSSRRSLTPSQLSDLDTQMRMIIDASKAYAREGVTPQQKIAASQANEIRQAINKLIKKKDKDLGTDIASMKNKADIAYKRKENFLDNNSGAIKFANLQNKSVQDVVDAENLLAKATDFGIDVNKGRINIPGRMATGNQTMTSSEVLQEYLSSGVGGVKQLSRLLNKTNEKGLVVESTTQFRRLALNEIESLFDDTLFKSLRTKGAFDTTALREALGFQGKGAAKKKLYWKELLDSAYVGEKNSLIKITMNDLDKFTKHLDKLQPEPDLLRFFLRRASLAFASGVSLKSAIPVVGGIAAGGATAMAGIPGLGLLWVFQKFMAGKYGRGSFAKVTNKKTMKNFLDVMLNRTQPFADQVNQSLFKRLGSSGGVLANIAKYSSLDNIGENLEMFNDNLEQLSIPDAKSTDEAYGRNLPR